VSALATSSDGDLVALTTLPSGPVRQNTVARWNGTSWQQLGGVFATPLASSSGFSSLVILPDGDIVVSGWVGTASTPYASVLRWNGSTWLGVPSAPSSPVSGLRPLANGDLLACGLSLDIGSGPVGNLARLTTTCPATVATSGTGCSGSAGINTLAATSLPWLGSTFSSTAMGLANLALGVAVLGLSPVSVPLAAIVPQGLPGCALLASPDLLTLDVVVAGTASLTLMIPQAPALVGQSLRQQLVALELGAAGDIAALSSTNALVLTFGAF
jgi:hypothetical protein